MTRDQRAQVTTITLLVLLIIMTLAFTTMIGKYRTQLDQFDRLEKAHLQIYSAYETCDAERWAP